MQPTDSRSLETAMLGKGAAGQARLLVIRGELGERLLKRCVLPAGGQARDDPTQRAQCRFHSRNLGLQFLMDGPIRPKAVRGGQDEQGLRWNCASPVQAGQLRTEGKHLHRCLEAHSGPLPRCRHAVEADEALAFKGEIDALSPIKDQPIRDDDAPVPTTPGEEERGLEKEVGHRAVSQQVLQDRTRAAASLHSRSRLGAGDLSAKIAGCGGCGLESDDSVEASQEPSCVVLGEAGLKETAPLQGRGALLAGTGVGTVRQVFIRLLLAYAE
jgi:hypothetical protein